MSSSFLQSQLGESLLLAQADASVLVPRLGGGPAVVNSGLHYIQSVCKLTESYFASVAVAEAVDDAFDVDVRQVGLVAVEELAHVDAVEEADVRGVYQPEQLVRVLVLTQSEFVEQLAH